MGKQQLSFFKRHRSTALLGLMGAAGVVAAGLRRTAPTDRKRPVTRLDTACGDWWCMSCGDRSSETYPYPLSGPAGTDGADRDDGSGGRYGYPTSLPYLKTTLDIAGFTTSRQEFARDGETGWNLIADWPGGDEDDVVVAGVHLDSADDGGLGSAAVLEAALAVSRAGLVPERHLRFAWWAGEDGGTGGFDRYLDGLPEPERAKVGEYLDFDTLSLSLDRL